MSAAQPSSLAGINLLPEEQKRGIYARLVPPGILSRFNITPDLCDSQGRDLLVMHAEPGKVDVEMMLYPFHGAQDPVLHGHITDTLYGHLHILIYVINDPSSPRYDIDRLPDGRSTQLGADKRNLKAEEAALRAGLAPGQVRAGLRLLGDAIQTFEIFVKNLGHIMYFSEPLYYHNAILFERYGFTYQQGRKLMERIQRGFAPGGELRALLDKQNPFRQEAAVNSIRLRSWAIHDNILGEPFTNVTMYKHVGKHSGLNSCPDCAW